jgi:hypothetical protein
MDQPWRPEAVHICVRTQAHSIKLHVVSLTGIAISTVNLRTTLELVLLYAKASMENIILIPNIYITESSQYIIACSMQRYVNCEATEELSII